MNRAQNPEPLPPGVWRHRQRFAASVKVGRRKVLLGRFDTSDAAAAVAARARALIDQRRAAGQPVTAPELRGEPPAGDDLFSPFDPKARRQARETARLARQQAAIERRLRARLSARERKLAKGEADLQSRLARAAVTTAADAAAVAASACPPAGDQQGGDVGEAGGADSVLTLLLEEFVREVQARGRTSSHVRELRMHVESLLGFAGARVPIKSSTIARFLARAREAGRSASTLTKMLVNLKSFFRWAVDNEHLEKNPAAACRRYPVARDRRYLRTSFSEAQAAQLLAVVARSARAWQGIVGRDRAEAYHAMMVTGVRVGTLAVLRAGQFFVAKDDPHPRVCVDADQIKDGEDLVVPIQRDAADRIAAYLAGRPADSPAFRMPDRRWAWGRMLKADLVEAGIPRCQVKRLPNGRLKRTATLDHHSLRYTFVTRCARADVPLIFTSKWVGHSDVRLTAAIYSQLGAEESAQYAAKLKPIGTAAAATANPAPTPPATPATLAGATREVA